MNQHDVLLSNGLRTTINQEEDCKECAVEAGAKHQGGLNVYSVRQDDHLVTVLGEAPGATIRLIVAQPPETCAGWGDQKAAGSANVRDSFLRRSGEKRDAKDLVITGTHDANVLL